MVTATTCSPAKISCKTNDYFLRQPVFNKYGKKKPQFHGRSNYIAIRYHFIQEQDKNGNVEFKYGKTDEMTADFMTKGLNSEKFEKLKLMAGMASNIEHPEASEKEC